MMVEKKVLSPFWFFALFCTLSLGWLSPNHYAPWSSFHSDAWVAFVLTLAACAVIVRAHAGTMIFPLSGVVAMVMLIPLVQLALGMHFFSGTAWMAAAYLGGLLLALLVGAMWEKFSPRELGDGLFLAIVVASVVSVGLQLHQWLLLDLLFIWDMGNLTGRPYANFGQPNMLATFLLWGVLGLGWGVFRGTLSILSASFIALYLLLGVALTGSRTGWISVALIMCAAWYWRSLSPNRWTPLIVTGLTIYFAACVTLKGPVLGLLGIDGSADLIRAGQETRHQIWGIFLTAVLERPISGYGWNQISLAHLANAADGPPVYVLLTQAHNLFLDLLLWCGVPLGLLIGASLVAWFVRHFLAIKTSGDALLLMAVAVVGNHAMLEYPLNYAYLLLPTGLFMGMLDQRLGKPVLTIGARWPIWSLVASLSLLLALITRDYLRVEASYLAFRFEQARLKPPDSSGPPEVLLLDNLGAMMAYFRYEPHRNMTVDELAWMRNVANLYPSAGVIHKMAAAMAWNGKPAEASVWLSRLCNMVQAAECESVKTAWARQAQTDPDIKAVPWPKSKKE